jgi:hypothetical protein
MINGSLAGVGKKLSEAEEGQVGGFSGDFHIAGDPGGGGAILRKFAVVIGGVHMDGDSELLEVIATSHLLAAALGV